MAPFRKLFLLFPSRTAAANLVGMGIGPTLVGVMSEGLEPRFGGDSFSYAMLYSTCR